ncbi:MAG TPA: bifunctional adenosylcobinamide kinase/adenosylcobinamide-phosphate guanylyltransferase [Nocardioidaceae bacterium]|nr:bifunctional adenosylcobinamide kinase/adenosylcobinamide-phosphate guanylyltransferase [Nocardioidaceae bacterium]
MRQVVLLGTGSADGWPNPFCGCASCRSEQRGGRVRGQTSALVDGRLLLDAGPETVRAAARLGVDLAGVRTVLITHDHPDHCAPAFLLYRSWAQDAPLHVVGPASVVEQARGWADPAGKVGFTAVAPGDRLQVGGYDVRVLAADHEREAVLYDVGDAGTRLLYATDTGPLPDATVAAAAGAAYDLVLLEETFGDHASHGTRHLDLGTFPDQLRRLREVGAIVATTDVVAVHLSHHNPPTPELDRRLAAWRARTVPDGATLHLGAPLPPEDPPTRTLVLGGARSGKSSEAQRLLAAEPAVTYVATGYPPGPSGAPGPADPEWAERVRRHRADRPAHWSTVETLSLEDLLDQAGEPLLIDCLTLWLTRVMDQHDAWDDGAWRDGAEAAVLQRIDRLARAWTGARRRVVAVSNEVGQGLVPGSAAERRFRDLMGRLNAEVAARSEDVRWCVAGRVHAW